MTDQLIVKEEILIKATAERVWEVLIKPKYIVQWDDLPEDYPSEDMKKGSQVIWDNPNGGHTITTVIKAEEGKELKIALDITNWEVKPKEGDVAYLFQLEEQNNTTRLKIEIGDFPDL